MEGTKMENLFTREMKRLLGYQRSMDMTRNLSVFIVACMAYFTFGLPKTSNHLILFLGSVTVFALLIFESQTFRYAGISAWGVRSIERNYLAPAIDPSIEPEEGWEKELAENLTNYKPSMNFLDAFSGRVYKNYFIIFLGLDACWFSKLYLFPHPSTSWSEFLHRLDFGAIPAWVLLGFVAILWPTYVVLIVRYRRKYKKKGTAF